jgi:hypothetical protein
MSRLACYVFVAMWRLVACSVLVGACGRAPKPHALVLQPAELVTVSIGGDSVEPTMTPALALGNSGLLVTWVMERRGDEIGNPIVARRLSLEGEPLGNIMELGKGWWTSATASGDGYVVAWRRPIPYAPVALGFAGVSSVADSVLEPQHTDDTGIHGPPSLVSVGDTVVAADCSHDWERIVLVREPLGDLEVEQLAPRDGCNDARLATLGDLLLVDADDNGGTELIELDASSARSIALLDASCVDDVVLDGETVLVCMKDSFGNALHYRRRGRGPEPFTETRRIDLDLGRTVFDVHAVALDQGVFLAWTIEVPDGFRLRAALVGKDGRMLTSVIDVSEDPIVPRFDLVGRGADAWLAFVTERQVDDERYTDDVVVTRMDVTGK